MTQIDLHAPTDPDYFKRLQASKERAAFFKKREDRLPEVWESQLMALIGSHTTLQMYQGFSRNLTDSYLTPTEAMKALDTVGVKTIPKTIGEFMQVFKDAYIKTARDRDEAFVQNLQNHFT